MPATRTVTVADDLSKTGSNAAASAVGLALPATTGAGFVKAGGGGEVRLEVLAGCCRA